MTIKTTPPRCGQKGFTLIEIVMVLVLLGILAAVAVPKYFDLEEEANKAVAKTVEQEMQARLEGEFAQSMLNGQTCENFSVISPFTGQPTTGVTNIAGSLAITFNATSSRAKVFVDGTAPGPHMAPLKISLNGGVDNYPYNGMLYFPKCAGE